MILPFLYPNQSREMHKNVKRQSDFTFFVSKYKKGMIRDGSGMIRDGSRMIWDGSGMIWDGSRMIRDGSGMIRELHKKVKTQYDFTFFVSKSVSWGEKKVKTQYDFTFFVSKSVSWDA